MEMGVAVGVDRFHLLGIEHASQRPARLGALVGNQISLPLVLRGGCFPGIPEFALAQKFGLLQNLLALQ